jgi:O-antigen/teichoic acid export membrane protein
LRKGKSVLDSRIRSSGNSRQVFENTAALTLLKVVTLFVNFLVVPLCIKLLGMQMYGLWAIINGVIGYFSLMDFGAGSAFLTQFALFASQGMMTRIRQVMTFGAIFYLSLMMVFFPAAWIVSRHLFGWFHISDVNPQVLDVFWWSYAYLFLIQAFGGFDTFLYAIQRMKLTTMVGIIAQIANSLILVTCLLAHLSMYSFVVANYTSFLGKTLVLYWLARNQARGPLFCNPFKIQRGLIKELFSFGAWMQVNNISNQINMETDRVLIGVFVNAGAVSVYELANKLSLLSRTIPLNFLGALLPAISSLEAHGNREKIKEVYIDASRLLALLTIYFAGFVVAASYPISVLWLGRSMPQLSGIIILLTVAYVVNNLTGVGTTILRAIAKPRLESYYALLGAGMNIALTLLLAPRYGVWGIVLGTLIGSVIGSVYFVAMFQRQIGLTWYNGFWRWLLPLCISGLASSGVIATISHIIERMIFVSRGVALLLVIVLGLVYTVLYLGFLVLLRYFKQSDISRIQRVIPGRLMRKGRFLLGVLDRGEVR